MVLFIAKALCGSITVILGSQNDSKSKLLNLHLETTFTTFKLCFIFFSGIALMHRLFSYKSSACCGLVTEHLILPVVWQHVYKLWPLCTDNMIYNDTIPFFALRTTIRSSNSRWTWAQSRNDWRITTTAVPANACRTLIPCSPTVTSTIRCVLPWKHSAVLVRHFLKVRADT